jgi:hypothetical protein
VLEVKASEAFLVLWSIVWYQGLTFASSRINLMCGHTLQVFERQVQEWYQYEAEKPSFLVLSGFD